MAAFEQICEWAKFENLTTADQAKERLNQFVDFWREQARNQIRRIEKHTSANKTVDMLYQALQAGLIGTKVYVNGKWQDSVRNFPSYPIKDVTYPDHGRKLMIMSEAILLRTLNSQISGSGIHIAEGKFKTDLKESGLIDMDGEYPIYYPIPDDRGFIDPNKPSVNVAIDYTKLTQLYKENLQ